MRVGVVPVFALRQLRVSDAPELEAEPDQRDLGNWLHAVLKAFHEARVSDPTDGLDDRQRLDALAQAEAGVNVGVVAIYKSLGGWGEQDVAPALAAQP